MDTSIGALVLAGGGARRMQGRSKALLPFGGHTFLQRQVQALSGFPELLLSTNNPKLAKGTPFIPVPDRVPGRGPLEGIGAALAFCKSQGLLVVACDMPLFCQSLADYLVNASYGHSAVACLDRSGRLHPLCGVYRKECLPAIDAALASGKLCMSAVFEAVGGVAIPLEGAPFPDSVLTNINTPGELARLSGQAG